MGHPAGKEVWRASCPPSLLHLPHLGAGRGRLFRAGQARRRPPTPGLQPGTGLGSLGKAGAGPGVGAWAVSAGHGLQAAHRGALVVPRGPAPVRPWQEAERWKVQVSRPGRTMAPPRDVVKIAVQKRDAIPQLIQLDQVTRPSANITPLPTSGSPPSPRNSPPSPVPRFSPTPGPVRDAFTCRQSPWPLC